MTRPQYRPLVFIATATAVAACASPGIDVSPVLEMNGDRVDIDVSGHHERGLADMQAGRLGRALQEFRQALRENPESIETLNAIAVAYDLMSRFEMAHHYYERALALNPDSFQTLNNLGRSYLAKGSVQLASKYLERARSIDPSAPQLRENLELLAALKYPLQSQSVQENGTTELAVAPGDNTWIERTSAAEQTFVTTASPQVVEALAALNVDPRSVSFKADLGRLPSEPREEDGSVVGGFANSFAEDPASTRKTARPETSVSYSSEKLRSPDLLWRGVVPSDDTFVSDTAASPERILAEAADHKSGDSLKQTIESPGGPVTPPGHSVFVRRSPRAIGHQLEHSKLAMEAEPAPALDEAMSLKLSRSVASFHGSLNGTMSEVGILSQGSGSAPVLASFKPSAMPDERIQASAPGRSSVRNEQVGQRSRRAQLSNDAVSAKALNACILKKIKSGSQSTAATTTPAAMALTEVSNGVGRYRMAARMGSFLSTKGFCLSRLSDAKVLGQTVSRIFYSSGFESQAKLIVEALPVNIPIEKDDTLSSNVLLVLGTDLLKFDSLLEKGV